MPTHLAALKIRFKFIFLAVYLLVSGTLLGVCVLNMFHSNWCEYFINSMFPAVLIHDVLRDVLVPLGIVRQSSEAFLILDGVLLIPVPFILTLAQYYCVGLLIDRMISWRARRKSSNN
jgi:hypothetical protein